MQVMEPGMCILKKVIDSGRKKVNQLHTMPVVLLVIEILT